MKKKVLRIISVVLCFAMLVSGGAFNAYAADESIGDVAMKGLYNALNVVVEVLVKGICAIYPDPPSWQDISEYNSEEIGFLPGRETYQTEAGEGNVWSLGYASKSIIPDDFESGKYNLGRDLLNKLAEGVYDDQRIRVAVIDDNSGEGAVVIGAVDSLGVTSTDTRAIRKEVLKYCAENGKKIASINIVATHAHSALDTQGVSTEFFRKLFGSFYTNLLGIESSLPGLENADAFKEFFLAKSVDAIIEAIVDVENGELYFGTAACGAFVKDKRGLISREDIPEVATLCFKPFSGSEATYISDITCHPTSFSASNGLVGSDYIYYLDKYIKETNGGNFIMVPGALGQVSRDIDVNTEGMTEYEEIGASARALGTEFGKVILGADYSLKLDPILNAKHREIFISPENSILTLACEVRLVNNKIFTDGVIFKEAKMATEIGYVEFGNKIGFALFPGELYPETFWGTDINGGATWDGTEWQFDSLHNSVDGVSVYAVSLANDAIGYVLTDNNFAFMGHIIGDGIADEVLSVGKHIGSFLVTEYLEVVKDFD